MNKDSKNTNKTDNDIIKLNTSSFLDMKINPMQEPGNYLFLGNEWGFFGAVRDGKYYAEDNIDDGENLYSVNLFNLAVQVNKGSVVYVVGKKNELEDYWSVILNKVATIIGKKFSYHFYYIEDFKKKFNISKKNEAYLKAVSFLKETKKLKFRYINMNPPYDGNLHLKILSQTIPMLTDDGICVNLSPIRWLQDPLFEYKPNAPKNLYKDTVINFIQNMSIVSAQEATEYFGTYNSIELGVYTLTKKGGFDVSTFIKQNRVFDIVVRPIREGKFPSILNNRTVEGSPNYDSPFVRLSVAQGHKGKNDWCNIVSPNSLKKEYKGKYDATANFNTENETVNFYNSCKTTFMKYIVLITKSQQRVPYGSLPWMGDCINSRTGLKGYEGEWTDDDFCKYFGITDDEWNEIVETMKPYLQETIVEK